VVTRGGLGLAFPNLSFLSHFIHDEGIWGGQKTAIYDDPALQHDLPETEAALSAKSPPQS